MEGLPQAHSAAIAPDSSVFMPYGLCLFLAKLPTRVGPASMNIAHGCAHSPQVENQSRSSGGAALARARESLAVVQPSCVRPAKFGRSQSCDAFSERLSARMPFYEKKLTRTSSIVCFGPTGGVTWLEIPITCARVGHVVGQRKP
jgi:hypothetical protein